MTSRDPLELVFLGSGNAFAPSRCWSGFLVNGHVLFDAPPSALYSLKKLGLQPGRIDTIFISHFHADHFFGLPFLLLEYAYESKRESPLTIVGPAGIEDRVRTLTELGYPSVLEKNGYYGLRYVEVEDGCEATINGIRFSATEVDHAGEALQCYGFRAQIGDRTLAYTGDSTYCPQLVDLGRGADVMVTDCTYPRGRGNPEHMSLDEVKDLRERIGGNTAFVLTHMSRTIDPGGLARVIAAEDAGRYAF